MTSKLVFVLALFLLTTAWEEENFQEVPCDPNCKTCDNSTTANGTCVKCIDHFYIDDLDNKCEKCSNTIAHCLDCSLTNEAIVECSLCYPSFYLQKNICKACQEAVPHCQLCSAQASNDTAVQCSLCQNTYYAFSIFECKLCSETFSGCLTCSQPTTSRALTQQSQSNIRCTSCINIDEFLTNDFKACKPCADQIEHCSSCFRSPQTAQTASLQCNTCSEGYQLNDDKTECVEGSSHTLGIILGVVGGLAVIGVGIGVWKYWQKKRKHSTLLEQAEQEQ